jgi:hypothetical protein
MSKYPHGLRECFTTGGIPPISASVCINGQILVIPPADERFQPEQVYKATFQKVAERNKVGIHLS